MSAQNDKIYLRFKKIAIRHGLEAALICFQSYLNKNGRRESRSTAALVFGFYANNYGDSMIFETLYKKYPILQEIHPTRPSRRII